MTARQSPTAFRPDYHGGRWAQGQETHERVVNAVDLLGPCPASVVAVRLDLSVATVLSHLHDAEEIGTVVHTGQARASRWELAP